MQLVSPDHLQGYVRELLQLHKVKRHKKGVVPCLDESVPGYCLK